MDPQNSVKVWFQKQQPSPTKDAAPCSSRSESWLDHAWQKLQNSSALLQPHSGSWLLKARWKLNDLAIKIPVDAYCQPWPLSLIGIIAVLFTIGPDLVAPQNWDLGQKLRLAVCYLTIVGSLILSLLWSILPSI